jgi:hypothetical protein
MLDALFTGETISDALDETKRRRRWQGLMTG